MPVGESELVSDTAFSIAIVVVTVLGALVAIRAAWRLLTYRPDKSRKT